MSEHYAYIGLHKKHVNLVLYPGASLTDPNSLLAGPGKRFGHIRITSLAEARHTQIKTLIAEAIVWLQGSIG